MHESWITFMDNYGQRHGIRGFGITVQQAVENRIDRMQEYLHENGYTVTRILSVVTH
jgi:hypothetical protein